MTDSNQSIPVRDEPYVWVRAAHGATKAHLVPLSMQGSANPKCLCRRRVRAPRPRELQTACGDCTELAWRVRSM